MAPLRLSHDRQSLGISPSLQARFAMREMNDEEDFFGADEFRSLKQALKLDGDGDDGDDGSSSDYEDDFDDAQESRDRSVALSRVPSGKSPSRKLSRHVSGPSGGGLGLLGEAAVGEKTTMKKSGMTMSRSAHFHSYAADDDPPLLSQPKRSGSEIPKAEKKLSLKERLKRVEPTVPRAPKRPPREPSSHAVDRARRADAIVALLDRKREDYREQYRAEVLEHSIRARERVERLGAKSLVKRDAGVVSILPEDRVNELSPPGPPPIMASSDPRKRPPTLPTTHRNPVPPTWTDSRWYKEIVEQMHRPRASHHHQAAVDLDRIASRDVLFGRLLTPGAKEFHIQSKKDHLEPTIIIRRRSPPPINAHGRPSMLKRKRKMIRIVPEISAKSKWKEISVATQQQQQPIPPPPMPSLIRPLCLSKASEEVCAQDQVKFDSKVITFFFVCTNDVFFFWGGGAKLSVLLFKASTPTKSI
ncbi:hypothetical protein DFS34DRAFT_153559 [Phlyctochytrium arcticum]|nr:hypothetical protein DFS34DRAFT_153559 [Phlyctochytrium arcticum]